MRLRLLKLRPRRLRPVNLSLRGVMSSELANH